MIDSKSKVDPKIGEKPRKTPKIGLVAMGVYYV